MQIMFNSLLRDADIDLGDVRLLRHKDQRAEKGRTPYELWRDDRPKFELYQSHQKFQNHDRLNAKYWASFLGVPGGRTVFVGLYSVKCTGPNKKDVPLPHKDGVDKAGTCDAYILTPDPRFTDFDGRLFIDWGDGTRSWIQYADRQNKPIVEVLTERTKPKFPGFLNLVTQLSAIDAFHPEWVEILKNAKGVYLLTCPKTKEQYVGSAYGDDGFWGRWQDYCRNGHGGNIALKSRDPSDYQVSILEVTGTSLNYAEIIGREALWKKKLQSQDMGLNRN